MPSSLRKLTSLRPKIHSLGGDVLPMLKLTPLLAHVASELLDGSGVEGVTESVMRDVRVEGAEENGVIVEAELAECVEVRADVKGEVMNEVASEVNVELRVGGSVLGIALL